MREKRRMRSKNSVSVDEVWNLLRQREKQLHNADGRRGLPRAAAGETNVDEMALVCPGAR